MIEGSSTSPTASDRHYYHTNHQGSVVGTTQASGTLIDEYAYDEYGKLTDDSRASTAGQPYRYTGRRYDEETGLYYYRARYYAPELGRFLQTDPIGYGDDVNLYAYVKNDPLNYIDQSGAFVVPPGVVYGAIAGFSGGFAASGGSWKGGFVGAFAGGVVGIANPALSNRAGAFVTGALASALGQAVGSGYDAAIKSGIENTFSGVVVDPITTVAGGLGAHFGNMVGNGVATAIKARPIIGVAMQNAGMPTRTGLAAGAAVEGGITGAAERGADMFTISITQGNDGIGSDSLGGFPGSGSEGAKSLSTSCLSIRGCGGMGLNF